MRSAAKVSYAKKRTRATHVWKQSSEGEEDGEEGEEGEGGGGGKGRCKTCG
jgi:hypothetical protein